MTDTLPLLQEFYREKLAMLLQHQAGARLVGQYDVNNTYQYIVNRDDVQLSWIAKAIEELGGAVAEQTEPSASASGKASEAARRVIDEDGREAQAFVDRWRPRVESMTPGAAPQHAAGDSGRDARAEALLRPGAGRPHRSARVAAAPRSVPRTARCFLLAGSSKPRQRHLVIRSIWSVSSCARFDLSSASQRQ